MRAWSVCWFWHAGLDGWAYCRIARSLVFSQHQAFAAPFEIPTPVLALASVKYGLLMFCAMVLYRLFGLYGQGKYFTAANITYIRFLGYYVIVDWVVTAMLESLSHESDGFFTQPMAGLLVIFIAWIMDEGRKIQEEQELTV